MIHLVYNTNHLNGVSRLFDSYCRKAAQHICADLENWDITSQPTERRFEVSNSILSRSSGDRYDNHN